MASKYDNKFLDAQGVKYLWDKAEGIYVKKEEDKVLSDENFTTEEKEKLAGLNAYELPSATSEILGGIKIGNGLSIDEHGVVSASAELPADVDCLSLSDLDFITRSPESEETFRSLLTEGGDIKLANDISLTEVVNITADSVIDLGGHSITSSAIDYAFVSNNAKVVFKNGSITSSDRIGVAANGGEIIIQDGEYNSTNVAFVAVGVGSKVTFNSGSIRSSKGGLSAFDKGTIVVNGGTIRCTDGFAVYTTGTPERGKNVIMINGGLLISETRSDPYKSCGVYIANDDTLTMTDGEILSRNGCGLLMRGGNVFISGGSITAQGNDPGWIEETNVLMKHTAVIYHQNANHPGKEGMSLSITGGTFTGTDFSIEILSDEITPNVSIVGGTFNPSYN